MATAFVSTGTCRGHVRDRSAVCNFRVLEGVAAVAAAGALFVAPPGGLAILSFDHDQSLINSDFSNRTDLVGAIFTKANCQAANLTNADLTNANIEDANFTDADLSSAKMSNVFATKTKFIRAKLNNAYLEGANLIGARFDGADITGADFTDAIMDPATVKKLCKKASGVNSLTNASTAESLNCPDAN